MAIEREWWRPSPRDVENTSAHDIAKREAEDSTNYVTPFFAAQNSHNRLVVQFRTLRDQRFQAIATAIYEIANKSFPIEQRGLFIARAKRQFLAQPVFQMGTTIANDEWKDRVASQSQHIYNKIKKALRIKQQADIANISYSSFAAAYEEGCLLARQVKSIESPVARILFPERGTNYVESEHQVLSGFPIDLGARILEVAFPAYVLHPYDFWEKAQVCTTRPSPPGRRSRDE